MLSFGLQTGFEVILVLAVLWGIFHEDRLIVLEKRLFAAIRRRHLQVVKPTVSEHTSFKIIEFGK